MSYAVDIEGELLRLEAALRRAEQLVADLRDLQQRRWDAERSVPGRRLGSDRGAEIALAAFEAGAAVHHVTRAMIGDTSVLAGPCAGPLLRCGAFRLRDCDPDCDPVCDPCEAGLPF